MSVLDKMVAAVTPPESDEARADARMQAHAAAQPGDWLSLILEHHEQLEAAFDAVENAGDSAARRTAQKKLGALLTAHAMAEEAVVYPCMTEASQKGHAAMAYEEQSMAKVQMARLEKIDPMSQDYMDKLGHLRGAVAHHMYSEESKWFLELKDEAPMADQTMIRERYEEEFNRYMGGGATM